MNPANRQIRVVALCSPGSTQQQITEALISQDDFILVDILASKEMLARQIRAAEPDIILVDSQLESESTMDIIDDLAIQFPAASVVAILPTNDPGSATGHAGWGTGVPDCTIFTDQLVSTLRRVTDGRTPATNENKCRFLGTRIDKTLTFRHLLQSSGRHRCDFNCHQHRNFPGRRDR
jgi:DNA-binding NarL/FixJ family response regulator